MAACNLVFFVSQILFPTQTLRAFVRRIVGVQTNKKKTDQWMRLPKSQAERLRRLRFSTSARTYKKKRARRQSLRKMRHALFVQLSWYPHSLRMHPFFYKTWQRASFFFRQGKRTCLLALSAQCRWKRIVDFPARRRVSFYGHTTISICAKRAAYLWVVRLYSCVRRFISLSFIVRKTRTNFFFTVQERPTLRILFTLSAGRVGPELRRRLRNRNFIGARMLWKLDIAYLRWLSSRRYRYFELYSYGSGNFFDFLLRKFQYFSRPHRRRLFFLFSSFYRSIFCIKRLFGRCGFVAIRLFSRKIRTLPLELRRLCRTYRRALRYFLRGFHGYLKGREPVVRALIRATARPYNGCKQARRAHHFTVPSKWRLRGVEEESLVRIGKSALEKASLEGERQVGIRGPRRRCSIVHSRSRRDRTLRR